VTCLILTYNCSDEAQCQSFLRTAVYNLNTWYKLTLQVKTSKSLQLTKSLLHVPNCEH